MTCELKTTDGKRGRVRESDVARERYIVDLEDGRTFCVRRVNLQDVMKEDGRHSECGNEDSADESDSKEGGDAVVTDKIDFRALSL